jgi:hypothetical protein
MAKWYDGGRQGMYTEFWCGNLKMSISKTEMIGGQHSERC